METDGLLAAGLLEGTAGPALRLYRWSPPALSLGFHQDISRIDTAACAAAGVDVVRRPTGGRAVLHADELTYCVAMETGGRGVMAVYRAVSAALVRGLRIFGVHTELVRSDPRLPVLEREDASIPCFSSSARYEITWRGRKLVGSAQRRYTTHERDVVLQHGSILTGPAHRRLPEFVAASPEVRARLREDLESRTTDLTSITGRAPDPDLLADAVRRGFEEEWGIAFDHHHQGAFHG
jgi:lipoate-protein ligase A